MLKDQKNSQEGGKVWGLGASEREGEGVLEIGEKGSSGLPVIYTLSPGLSDRPLLLKSSKELVAVLPSGSSCIE